VIYFIVHLYPHVNKTVTDFFWVYIPIYPPSLRPWWLAATLRQVTTSCTTNPQQIE